MKKRGSDIFNKIIIMSNSNSLIDNQTVQYLAGHENSKTTMDTNNFRVYSNLGISMYAEVFYIYFYNTLGSNIILIDIS